MKVAFLFLIAAVLMGVAGCTTDDSGATRSDFGGPPAMSGSDSNASDNRY